MTIKEQHYDIKLKLNKLDSEKRKDFNPAEIDWALNNWGIPQFIKTRYGINNYLRYGFEVIQKRIEDLKELVVKSPTTLQPAVTATSLGGNLYEVKISSLAKDYLFFIRGRATISKTGCTDKKVKVTQIQHDDLDSALDSHLYAPDWNWGIVLMVEGQSTTDDKGSFYFYTDKNNSFTVKDFCPEYIRQPKQVWEGSYNTLNQDPLKGTVYTIGQTAVDCELNSYMHEEINNITAHRLAVGIEDPRFQQLRAVSLQEQE